MTERRKKRRKVKLCFGVQLKKEKIKSVGFLMTIFFRFSKFTSKFPASGIACRQHITKLHPALC